MNSSIIRETLREVNEKLFLPRSIHVELLKDYPHIIPVLVQWIYEEWRSYDVSLTQEKLHEGFKKRLNDHQLPFTLIALKNEEPIGLISLKEKGEPEFVEFSENSPWIGSFLVISEERNKGLGQALLMTVNSIAARLGYQQIFLYTSNPINVAWYRKRQAQVIELRPFRNHLITLMTIPLNN